MTTANQISPGMTINLDGKIFRVESSVKVTVAKGTPFVKTKLRNLITDEVIEKNFKLDQVDSGSDSGRTNFGVSLSGRERISISRCRHLGSDFRVSQILGDKVHFLKEGIQVKAMFYGETIFAIELPQFLEIMVVKTENAEGDAAIGIQCDEKSSVGNGRKITGSAFY